jgi:hypothetical protein
LNSMLAMFACQPVKAEKKKEATKRKREKAASAGAAKTPVSRKVRGYLRDCAAPSCTAA